MWPYNQDRSLTYSVAEPVFILVSGVTVVHVYAFALDGQTFLKEDDKNESSIPGEYQSHQ